MNGNVKWIAGILVTVSLFFGGIYTKSVDSKVDTIKVDTTHAIEKVETQTQKNSEDINQIKTDVAVIKEQSNQMLRLLMKIEAKTDSL